MTDAECRRMYRFKVTGVDRRGTRFVAATNSLIAAFGINLWRGSVWERTEDCTKWRAVKRVWN
jgi:hypothetical protein